MPRRVIVTGGAGFIASHLTDRLCAAGHQVAVIDNLVTGKRGNLNPAAKFYECDIRSPEAATAVQAWRPEVLFHFAAQMDVRRSVTDPGYDAEVNLIGLVRLMEAARPEVKKVIFASSGGAMYGEQDEFPARETHATRPASPYGVSKAASELYLQYYQQAYGIPYVALRFANIYGPRQDPHGEAGVVAIFAKRLLARQPLTVFGDGSQTRDYVFVQDAVTAAMHGLNRDVCGGFNIATGVETSVNELARVMADVAGAPADIHYAPARLGEQMRSCLDPALGREKLGLPPARALREGLGETVAFFAARAAENGA